jgi:GTP-binding protein EngB required for normal cell division
MIVEPDPKKPHAYQPYVEQIHGICREFRIDALMPRIAAMEETFQETDSFTVALLGSFKAGKSSFINCIAGRNVLPVAVVPLTAVITRIKYGPKDRATVSFLNEAEEKISLDQLADYITEQRNPNNVKQVHRVDIEIPEFHSYAGIQFVDTPGLGSVFTNNTLTAMDWLPRVGAAILTISIDHPLSEEDIRLLKELDKFTPEITILLTKADLVSPSELDDVLGFIRQQIESQVVKVGAVLPFSIRPGYKPLQKQVHKLLESFTALQTQKFHEISRHKLRTLIEDCRKYLQLALSAAAAEQSSRRLLQGQLQQEREQLSAIRNEIWLMTHGLHVHLQADAVQMLQAFFDVLMHDLTAELKNQWPHWHGHLGKVSNQFREWMEKELTSRLQVLSAEKGDQITQTHLFKAQKSFSRIVRAFQDRLGRSIEEALHITFSGAEFEARIKKPTHPDIQIGKVFDTDLELIWFLIPMWIFRPLVNRHFLRSLPWEVEKNLHRLASQWSGAVFHSIEALSAQAKSFMENELNTVENLLEKADDNRALIEKNISAVESIALHLKK